MMAATRYAGESAHLAQRIGAWSPFIGAHSILYAARKRPRRSRCGTVARAADRRCGCANRRSPASALCVVRAVRTRSRARANPNARSRSKPNCRFTHPVGATKRRCTSRSQFAKVGTGTIFGRLRQLAALDDRIVEASERRLWNAALSMLAAFDGDERVANARLRAYGKTTAAVAQESAIGNAQAECFAAIAQVLLGNPEAAQRRLPHHAPTTQTRALAAFAREIAELGATLGLNSAADALARLRAAGQEGYAAAFAAALDKRRPELPSSQ